MIYSPIFGFEVFIIGCILARSDSPNQLTWAGFRYCRLCFSHFQSTQLGLILLLSAVFQLLCERFCVYLQDFICFSWDPVGDNNCEQACSRRLKLQPAATRRHREAYACIAVPPSGLEAPQRERVILEPPSRALEAPWL